MGRADSETWKKYKSKPEWERDANSWRMGQRVPNFRQDNQYQMEVLNGSYVSGTDSEDKSTRFIVSHHSALAAFLRTRRASQWRFDINAAPKDGSMPRRYHAGLIALWTDGTHLRKSGRSAYFLLRGQRSMYRDGSHELRV